MLSDDDKKRIRWDAAPIDRSKIIWDEPQPKTQDYVTGGTGGTMIPSHGARSPYVPKPETFGEFIDPLLTVGSAALAEPAAGIAGIVQGLNPYAEDGAAVKAVDATRRALTRTPKTGSGANILNEFGQTVEPVAQAVGDAIQTAADKTFDVTGSPAAGAFMAALPEGAMALLGLKGYKALAPGTRLMENGRPTRQFRKLLDDAGLDYDSLSPEVKQIIPEIIEPKLLPGGKPVQGQVNKVITEQLKAGGKQDALHKYELSPEGTAVKDPLGVQAVNQGFGEGFVQSVKTANKATKAKMLKMSRMQKAISKEKRLESKIRPSDVVGDSVTERLNFVSDELNRSGARLNQIANSAGFKTIKVDPAPVVKTLDDALAGLDIKRTNSGGKIKLDFNGSDIMEDPTSQAILKKLVNLMQYGEGPTAYRFHKLKRQIDAMVDYNKKSPRGLTDAGKRVLKNVRHSLNESLRDLSPEYAKVNDTISSSLDVIDDLDKATGSIDIVGQNAGSAIGTRMRALLSNQQSRVKMRNAIDQLEKVSADFGGRFDDSLDDLVMFADELETRFGTTANASFLGQINKAVNPPLSKTQAAANVAGKVATKVRDKVKGINDFEAYEALEKLLAK